MKVHFELSFCRIFFVAFRDRIIFRLNRPDFFWIKNTFLVTACITLQKDLSNLGVFINKWSFLRTMIEQVDIQSVSSGYLPHQVVEERTNNIEMLLEIKKCEPGILSIEDLLLLILIFFLSIFFRLCLRR